VTNYCVECHTRTQQGPEFKLKLDALSSKMSSLEKLEYLVAFRQFDQALNEAEKDLLQTKRDNPLLWQLDRVARLGLQVAVQYKSDPNAAQKLVSAVEANNNLPYFLRTKTALWKKSLEAWKKQGKSSQNLEQARKLILEETSEIDSMRGLALLIQLLSIGPKAEELGETLYLTGVAYENLNGISPFSLHEKYFETCIRQVPHTSWSKKCFHNLEESIADGFTGSSGTHIPVDVHVKLEKLRQEAN
jgi:hypothetical protein